MKYLIWIAGLLLALVFLGAAFSRVDRPFIAADDFARLVFADGKAARKDNGYYALAALDAPPDTDNIYKAGAARAEADTAALSKAGTAERYKILTAEPQKPNGAISFRAGDALVCHLDAEGDCARVRTLSDIRADNAVLIRRYLSLRQYKNFTEVPGVPLTARNDILMLNRLIAGDAASPLSDLLANIDFLNNMLRQQQSVINRATFAIALNLNLEGLEDRLRRITNLTAAERAQVSRTLARIGMDTFDVPLMLRAEYRRLREVTGGDHAATQRKYLALAQDYAGLARKQGNERDVMRLHSDYFTLHDVFNPYQGIIANRMIAKTAEAAPLAGTMLDTVAHARLLRLYNDYLGQRGRKKLSPGVMGMEPAYLNPVTGRAFDYAPALRELSFTNRQGKKTRFVLP